MSHSPGMVGAHWRRAGLALLAAAIALTLIAPSDRARADEAVTAPALPLGHAGRWVTDAAGRVVILHGFNQVVKFPPYLPSGGGFDDDDAAFLASQGFNAVRVGVIYKAVEPQPGVFDDAYLNGIAQTVATLARHGVVSLLDFHQDMYNERFQGEGFPDWAVNDDGLPAQPQLGFPGNYLGQPATQRAFDNFWANTPGPGGVGLQDRFAAAWAHVAARFQGNSAVLGYELLNEPWPGSTWQQCANPAGCPAFDAQLTAFVKRVTGAIRAVDNRTLVWYEPNVIFNDGADTQLGPIGDPRLGFAFHDYCLSQDSTGSYSGCDTFDDMVFAHAEHRSAVTGDALLLTEFGSTDNAVDLTAMLNRADRNMVGWLEWAYTGNDPTSSAPGAQALVLDPQRPPTGTNVKLAKLKLLAEPYPQVVSGTPSSFGFDASSGGFQAHWSVTRAGGGGSFGPYSESDVAIPPVQYPAGYGVSVSGGAVASGAGAPVLRILSCPGAREVAVTVSRGAGALGGSCSVPGAGAPPGPGAAATKPALLVSVHPRRVRAGRAGRVVVRVRARLGGRLVPVRGVVVSIGHARARTRRSGRAVLHPRNTRAGRYRVIARARGYQTGRASLRAR
ncbi:MAG TPA: cellulase family glycosylhydrolase [Solirubrobacteraceae bacterium]|nr:cellulase family glycosylhydrolase [Solirubrobacteraceae bacterium]